MTCNLSQYGYTSQLLCLTGLAMKYHEHMQVVLILTKRLHTSVLPDIFPGGVAIVIALAE